MKTTAVNYGYKLVATAALGLACLSCQSSKASMDTRSQAIEQNNEDNTTILQYGSNMVESRGPLRIYDPCVGKEVFFGSKEDSSQYVNNHVLANAIVTKAHTEAIKEVQNVAEDYSQHKKDEISRYNLAVKNSHDHSPSFETYIVHQKIMDAMENNEKIFSKQAYKNYQNQMNKAENRAKTIRQKALNAQGVYTVTYHSHGEKVR